MIDVIVKGTVISATIMVAIGSQSVFILKQGMLKQHVFSVCFTCFLCDVILMTLGVVGLGAWLTQSTLILNSLVIAGIGFLLYYGVNAFRSFFNASNNENQNTNPVEGEGDKTDKSSLSRVILSTLAVTLLNPHIYLDSIVVIGGVATTFSQDEKLYFLIGALISSFIWIFLLGYGTRLINPLLKKANFWRGFDFFIGCIMFVMVRELVLFMQ